jgi:hypothetical protein
MVILILNTKGNGTDLCSKFDLNKPVGKAVKLIQSYLTNKYLFNAEKLQRNLKINKPEFLRLLALFHKVNNIFNSS